MHVRALALSAALLFAGSGTAQAQSSPYLGLDIYQWRFNAADTATARGTGLRLRGGLFVHPRVALELQAARGGSETVRSGPDGATRTRVEFDYGVGAFSRVFLPVADPLTLYGLVGVSRSQFTITRNGDASSRDTTGLSYGVGADLTVAPNASLLVEWTRYVDTDDFESSAITVGGRLRF